ncbi:MAG: erythromycin esterase [Cryobacterium sp.]|nr:erythromycin esterase [Cryobacterium sp.]
MTEDDILTFARSLPGVVAATADKDSGAPEAAWGDSFIFYDPIGDPTNQRFPFATVVASDYAGFDEASNLNRPGVFRLNIAVGRRAFEDLIGYPANQHPRHESAFDYTALDTLFPHPVYATQAWVSIVCPADKTTELVKSLLVGAHALAANRYARRIQPGAAAADADGTDGTDGAT